MQCSVLLRVICHVFVSQVLKMKENSGLLEVFRVLLNMHMDQATNSNILLIKEALFTEFELINRDEDITIQNASDQSSATLLPPTHPCHTTPRNQQHMR